MAFLRQLGWELFRMFARRRTWVGFSVFLLVEGLMLFFLTRDNAEAWFEKTISRLASGGFDEYFSALTLAVMIVTLTTFLLSTAFLALVAGDVVAKESEDGNLRLLLARPVSRLRILLLKYVACLIYAAALFFVIGLMALIVGLVTRGWGGGMIVINVGGYDLLSQVAIYDWWPGMERYFLMLFGLWISFFPVTSVAFALSCLKIKPATATIITIAYFIADFIVWSSQIASIEDYEAWFLAPKMERYILLLQQTIPWPTILGNWANLLGISLTLFVIGWVMFERRDVKS